MNILPKLLQAIAFLPAIVHAVESIFGSQSGADKKSAALSFWQTALCMTDTVGKSIVDHEKFEAGLGKVIDGVVECLNASIWAKQPSAEGLVTCKATNPACAYRSSCHAS